eukprot:2676166-Alexandrium_andersonii.AAC.1
MLQTNSSSILKIQSLSSEMVFSVPAVDTEGPTVPVLLAVAVEIVEAEEGKSACLLYTSDAADDM